jgi:hypothetical protein
MAGCCQPTGSEVDRCHPLGCSPSGYMFTYPGEQDLLEKRERAQPLPVVCCRHMQVARWLRHRLIVTRCCQLSSLSRAPAFSRSFIARYVMLLQLVSRLVSRLLSPPCPSTIALSASSVT